MRVSVRDLVSKENLKSVSLDITESSNLTFKLSFPPLQRWVSAFLGGGFGGVVGLGVADVVDAALLLHVLRPPQPDAHQPAAGRFIFGSLRMNSEDSLLGPK